MLNQIRLPAAWSLSALVSQNVSIVGTPTTTNIVPTASRPGALFGKIISRSDSSGLGVPSQRGYIISVYITQAKLGHTAVFVAMIHITICFDSEILPGATSS
jgi:hypothetical protein